MGLWDSLKGHAKAQFLDVIEWLDDSNDTMVWRFPIFNQAIQDGGKLVVREGQAAVFVSEGQLSDVFGPGTYTLSTRNEAIWSFFSSIKYQFNYPYKGDVYFVSTRQFTAQKWGTANPFMMKDPDIGPVRVRAFGIYAYRVTDPGQFLKEVVGTDGLFTTDEINGQLKRKLISAFTTTVSSSGVGVLDLGAKYMDMGEALAGQMSPWFEENYGLTLTDFTIENISLPAEVEKMLDKRSSMGLLGDLGAYTQFQAANAMEAAAENTGAGGMGAGAMTAGMGFAMGNVMAGQIGGAQGQGGAFNPGTAPGGPPPPPQAGGRVFNYSGPKGQSQGTAAQIAQLVAADPGGTHNLWSAGWPGWKPWTDVAEVASLVAPPPPPAPGGDVSFNYNGPGGTGNFTAADIANRVAAAPDGRHLVWQPGWPEWKDATTVPAIQGAAAASAPPPLPPEPPPLPE